MNMDLLIMVGGTVGFATMLYMLWLLVSTKPVGVWNYIMVGMCVLGVLFMLALQLYMAFTLASSLLVFAVPVVLCVPSVWLYRKYIHPHMV